MTTLNYMIYMFVAMYVLFIITWFYALIVHRQLNKAEKFIYIRSHEDGFTMKDYEEFKKYYK